MSAIYLIPYDSWDFSDPVFEFDADIFESRTDAYKWTEFAIESGSDVTRYGVKRPKKMTIQGVISAGMAQTDEEVDTRLPDTHAALVDYADTLQPLTLVTPHWTLDVVIEKVTAKQTPGDGQALVYAIDVKTFSIADYKTVSIPPELLAPSVKAGATEDTSGNGGNQATSESGEGEDGAGKSWAASLYDFASPYG